MGKFLEKLEIYTAILTGIAVVVVIFLQPYLTTPTMLLRLIGLILLAYFCGYGLKIYFIKRVVPPEEDEPQEEEQEGEEEENEQVSEEDESIEKASEEQTNKKSDDEDDPLDQLQDPDDTDIGD